MYSQKVIDRFKNPKYSGRLDNYDAIGEVGNAACGDIMRIFIKVGKNPSGEEYIEDIRFETFGCAAAISSSDILCEIAKGKSIAQALAIKKDDIIKELGDMPNYKVHCSVLASEALKLAIENYKKEKKI